MGDPMGPVLVIGATGQQGGATVRALLRRGWPVRAFVRDPGSAKAAGLRAEGVELVVGDLDDTRALRDAMDGVHGVFLMLTMMSGRNISLAAVAAEERRGKCVAELAAERGVAHLVYSSLAGAGAGSGIEYYAAKEHIEGHIRALGVPATVLRPVSFMDNFTTYNRPVRGENGSLTVALAVRPDLPMSLIAVRDIGEFAAIAFARPREFLGRTLTLAGDALTPPQIADTFARVTGMPARSVQVPIEQIAAFDEQVAKMFAFVNAHPAPAIDLGALRGMHPDLMDLETWLRRTNWKP